MTAAANMHVGNLFNITPLPVDGCPVFLAVALPGPALTRTPGFPRAAAPATGRVASGRGLTAADCRASAIGEAAELVSSCAWGSERLIRAADQEFRGNTLAPETLNGFSKAQIDGRHAWNGRYADFDWRPARRDCDHPIDWLEVQNASCDATAFVPADFAFIGRREAGDEEAVAIGDSNGCASGPDPDDARLAAVLELIERDAAARWWYGRRARPSLDARDLPHGPLAEWLQARSRRTRIFDITSDVDVPVAAAVSADDDGHFVALGFSARLDMGEAALAASTEMVQMEFALAAARRLGDAAPRWAEWRARVSIVTPPLDAPEVAGAFERSAAGKSPLASVLDACAARGVGIWFANFTRPAIGAPVFRAVSPELCHFKPRLGRARLLAPDWRDLGPVATRGEDQIPLLV